MLKIKHYKLKKAVNEDAQKDLSPLFRPHGKQKGATISYPNKILIWNNEILSEISDSPVSRWKTQYFNINTASLVLACS